MQASNTLGFLAAACAGAAAAVLTMYCTRGLEAGAEAPQGASKTKRTEPNAKKANGRKTTGSVRGFDDDNSTAESAASGKEPTGRLPRHKHTVGILDDGAGPMAGPPVFQMEEIGVISSSFPHRAGTPRQGTLAPHARSHLVLHSTVAAATLEGLEGYSHCWVVFRFHINVESGKNRTGDADTANKGTRYAAKVKPPRAGGRRVGIFSTRSPHRPNPVGLSLCLVERVDPKTNTLQLLGLDLVDGTPVYDVKPYIPWNSVKP